MPWQNLALNAAANGLAETARYASLHTTDPGSTGASELSGGSPAYARKAVSWGAAVAGERPLLTNQTFNVPVGATVAYVGFWDSASGGNFAGGFAVTSEGPYGAQGEYLLEAAQTKLDINAL